MARLKSPKELFGDHEEVEEDKEDNLRQFPHKANQFLVHMFAKCDQKSDEILSDFSKHFSKKYPKIEFLAERHVTLVNGFFCLRFHQIDPFVQSIQSTIASLKPFTVCLSRPDLFSNNKRLFLSFSESDVNQTIIPRMRQLFHRNNRVGEEVPDFRLHVSLATLALEERQMGEELVRELGGVEPLVIRVKEIELKIGNFCKKLYLK